ncbi:hypothetical protein ABFS83_11G089300 [Erythranthe nasuta]
MVLNDTSLRPENRRDILCRVFKMKLDSLMTDFKKGHIFGRIITHVCTIEFKKCGLPHAHILLWFDNDAKPKRSSDIDKMICAEILDKKTDKKMYNLVEKYMIHGMCGHANLNSPCMKDGVCTKRFPKKFVQRTKADPNGYPVYRMRDDGKTVRKKNTILDNEFVYLLKYVNKGHDRVTATFFQPPSTDADPVVRDEIKMYYDCRYLSVCEVMWRIFAFEIHYWMISNGNSMRNFDSMPMPLDSSTDDTENQLVLDELDYDMSRKGSTMPSWMLCRRIVAGCTSSTVTERTLSADVRSKGEIVLNVTSSGIASLLFPGGRTAHSRFGLPIIVHDGSTCSITQQSPQAELLIKTRLIIWDEALMMHIYFFETLDKTLRSITHVPKPFGGKVVVLGGDFRQILPVVLKASRQDIVHAMINSSQIWEDCKVLKLHTNMRLQSSSNPSEAGEQNDGESPVEIPEDMLIPDSEDPLLDLLQFVYPDLLSDISNLDYFQGRALLAPTNDCVEFINDYLCSLLPNEEKLYLSADTMYKDEMSSEENAQICNRIPQHRENVPVMLIRNIDQARGLCNGTRHQVVRMGTHVLSCKVVSGKNIGDVFQMRQFPLMVSFAMTINKSSGQTLSHVKSQE